MKLGGNWLLPHRTAPHRTAPHRTAPHRATQHRMHRTLQHITTLCRSAGEEVGRSLVSIRSPNYYTCWEIPKDSVVQKVPGHNAGLDITFHTHAEAIPLNPFAIDNTRAGVFIAMHNEDEPDFDVENSVFVPRGRRLDLQIQRMTSTRLKHPFGTNCADNVDGLSRCLRSCHDNEMARLICNKSNLLDCSIHQVLVNSSSAKQAIRAGKVCKSIPEKYGRYPIEGASLFLAKMLCDCTRVRLPI